MNASEIEQLLLSLIEKSVPKNLITNGWEERTLQELEIDSLSMAGVVIGVEEAYDIEIDMRDIDLGLMKKGVRPACAAIAEAIKPMIKADASH